MRLCSSSSSAGLMLAQRFNDGLNNRLLETSLCAHLQEQLWYQTCSIWERNLAVVPCPPPRPPSVSPRCQQIVPTHRGRRRSINCGFHICSEVSGQKDSSGLPLSYTLYFYRPLTAVRGVTWNSFRSAASARGRAQICFDSIPAKKCMKSRSIYVTSVSCQLERSGVH